MSKPRGAATARAVMRLVDEYGTLVSDTNRLLIPWDEQWRGLNAKRKLLRAEIASRLRRMERREA